MTVATFTAPQAEEMTSGFWSIDLGNATLNDGTVVDLGNYRDDKVTEIPLYVSMGQLSEQEDGTYLAAHPAITDEDVALITMVLDERAAMTATIDALPSSERVAARSALREQIRTAAREHEIAHNGTARAARVALRKTGRPEDYHAARVAYRAELKARALAAGLITETEPQIGP